MYDMAAEVRNRTHYTFKLVETTLGNTHTPPDRLGPNQTSVLFFFLSQYVEYQAQEDSNITFKITAGYMKDFQTDQAGVSLDVEPKGDDVRADIYITA